MAQFKVAVLVPDGAADLSVDALGGATPLEAAATPHCDAVVSSGATGRVQTVPPGMPPGSDVANLALLGYDPATYYGGRGPIEAANLGVAVPPGWTAFRCNLVSTDGERMLDYSAGHIGDDEAGPLIEALERELGDDSVHFHQGKSYRHLMLLRGSYRELETTPPHDITGQSLAAHVPRGPGADLLIDLTRRSREVLAGLPVNRQRAADGKRAADVIWPWGQGEAMSLEPFARRFGLRGAVISAVDLVNGLGVLAGLTPIAVPGITGYLDTNYGGKGEAAVRALDEYDFVYVHVEAPDEASHIGSAEEKVRAIERFDAMVVGPVLARAAGGGVRVMVCPDHPTLLSTLTHDGSAVPYAACGPGIAAAGSQAFTEKVAEGAGPHFPQGSRMMAFLCGKQPWPAS